MQKVKITPPKESFSDQEISFLNQLATNKKIKKKSGVWRFLIILPLFVAAGIITWTQVGGAKAGKGFTPMSDNPAIRVIEWPKYEGAVPESILIIKSTSSILRFDRPVTRTAISNDAIIDITPIGDQDLLVNAKEAGIANLFVWDDMNNIAAFNVESTLNIDKLKTVLSNIDPENNLNLVPMNDTVMIHGTAETSLKLKQVEEITKVFNENAVSFADLKESKQVLLEVRFAEINRKDNKDWKFDLELINDTFAGRKLDGKTGASSIDSDSTFLPSGAPLIFEQIGLPSEAEANLFGTFFDDDYLISNYIQWLETKNILKIIARPNLLAKDGEEANFVVGGEFPVPVATEDRIHIDYKEFGTKLKFTPELLKDGVIRLAIETEVSELDFSNTVTFSGVTIPSLIKRTHQTVAEMKNNQSFVIGGLLSQKVELIKRKVPLLGSIPLIGNVFSSEDFQRTDVELLVVVTPRIVEPFEMKDKKTYDPDAVEQAVRVYNPPYPDSHGDAIHHLLAEDETRASYTEDMEKHTPGKYFAFPLGIDKDILKGKEDGDMTPESCDPSSLTDTCTAVPGEEK